MESEHIMWRVYSRSASTAGFLGAFGIGEEYYEYNLREMGGTKWNFQFFPHLYSNQEEPALVLSRKNVTRKLRVDCRLSFRGGSMRQTIEFRYEFDPGQKEFVSHLNPSSPIWNHKDLMIDGKISVHFRKDKK